ncbi:hypothetical protein VT03_17115 [Planctomyces sp. SH-PL14]|jgi:hypothetical protein|nr:hypothetical protein VT03_17115 [Planctomyces sp. SH-PL14]
MRYSLASEERPSRLGRLLLFVACLGCGFAVLILAQRSVSRERDANAREMREHVEDVRHDLNGVTKETRTAETTSSQSP